MPFRCFGTARNASSDTRVTASYAYVPDGLKLTVVPAQDLRREGLETAAVKEPRGWVITPSLRLGTRIARVDDRAAWLLPPKFDYRINWLAAAGTDERHIHSESPYLALRSPKRGTTSRIFG